MVYLYEYVVCEYIHVMDVCVYIYVMCVYVSVMCVVVCSRIIACWVCICNGVNFSRYTCITYA